MKKLILVISIALVSVKLQAQCVAYFGSYYPDSTGLTYYFNDSSTANGSTDSVDLWIWNYGDGSTDSITIPSVTAIHKFNAPGQYTVCLQIFDFDSTTCNDTFCNIIDVQCTPECIWPGDANYDFVANNMDLLAIGIGYGFTGSSRIDQNINWLPKFTIDWNDTLINGTNYKHIDCNGDGIINASDTTAILQNYGKVHQKTSANAGNAAGDPPLQLDIVPDTAAAGSTAKVKINLGDAATPANNIYGLAFTVNYDNTKIKNINSFVFSNSWLGSASSLISVAHNDTGGYFEVALSRINHTDTSGNGEVGEMEIIMQDDIVAKIGLTISNVKVITANETNVSVSASGDSVMVIPAGINDIRNLNEKVDVYPNPSRNILNVSFKNIEPKEINITNVLGQTMNTSSTWKNARELKINIKDYSEGIYFLHIKTKEGFAIKKFSVIR